MLQNVLFLNRLANYCLPNHLEQVTTTCPMFSEDPFASYVQHGSGPFKGFF